MPDMDRLSDSPVEHLEITNLADAIAVIVGFFTEGHNCRHCALAAVGFLYGVLTDREEVMTAPTDDQTRH